MLILPNGCKCSKPSVVPKNWNKAGASVIGDWCISYRFYSPDHDKPKQVIMKGMNCYKTLAERRAYTDIILKELETALKDGYNPFTKTIVYEQENQEINRNTPLFEALKFARGKLKYVHFVLTDIKNIIKRLETAGADIRLSNLPIGETSRKHIAMLLDEVAKSNPRFSAHRHNTYRTYLMALFKVLIKYEALDTNPMHDIEKQRVVIKIRKTLTRKQRITIDEYLQRRCRRFWLFVNIFFHSGGRETELVRLKGKDVDLNAQKYTCLIKKGRQQREVEKTIKTVALPFWKEALEGCGADDYVFHKELRPGAADKPIRADQIGRRWYLYVKRDLKIHVDFYALKHLHSSEIVDMMDPTAAAAINSHTTTRMVDDVYDVRKKQRMHNKLVTADNTFV